MIDMKIGVGFKITNLTSFEWFDLQETCQRAVESKVFHALPETFLVRNAEYTYKDGRYLAIMVRRDGGSIEFLAVEKGIFEFPEVPF